jgi:hypothetical protein
MTKPKSSTSGEISACIAYTIGVILGIINIYFRLGCIDCSEARVFVDHWYLYVGGGALMIIFAMSAWWDTKKDKEN